LLDADIASDSNSTLAQTVDDSRPPRPTPLQQAKSVLRDRIAGLHIPALSVTQKRILKCALAYFLGSLFTYVKPLSGFLTDFTSDSDVPSPTGHMVATM
jgi:hypothetical protein